MESPPRDDAAMAVEPQRVLVPVDPGLDLGGSYKIPEVPTPANVYETNQKTNIYKNMYIVFVLSFMSCLCKNMYKFIFPNPGKSIWGN